MGGTDEGIVNATREGGGLDADVVVIMTIVNYSFGLEAVSDRWVSVLDHIVKNRRLRGYSTRWRVLGFLSLLLLSLCSPVVRRLLSDDPYSFNTARRVRNRHDTACQGTE